MRISAQLSLPLLILVSALAAIMLDWSFKRNDPIAPNPPVDDHHGPAMTRASANLPALFSTDDYPQAALRRNEQGVVAFTLSIDRRGRVGQCIIASSSGSATLDQATCDILQRRARFVPARDANGSAVADLTSGRIRWQLPDE